MKAHLEAILTPDEYEIPRATDEFAQWWITKHNMFGATREGVIYCREGKGMTKKLYEEAQPMLSFMRAYYSRSQTRCKLLAGTEADDAVLLNGVGNVEKRIQITFAGDGYADHLRRAELTKKGHVDALTKPSVQGKGRLKIVGFPEGAAVRHDTIVHEVVQNIEAAAQNKHSRGYSSGYSLVIGFNDSILNRDDWPDLVGLHNRISGWFTELFLIGIHGIVVVPQPKSA